MRMKALNFMVILFSAPIVVFTALVGGFLSGFYYTIFFLFNKFVSGDKNGYGLGMQKEAYVRVKKDIR